MLKCIQQLYEINNAKRMSNIDFSADHSMKNRKLEEIGNRLSKSDNYQKMTSEEKLLALQDQLILHGVI